MSSGELAGLKLENAHLLDELEMAYQQMEGVLAAADREMQVAYEELRKRNEELQRRLTDLEKAHRQLQEAQRMLLRSERLSAMGQMAAAIVHEINSPLTVIAGQTEMMLMEERDTAKRAELDMILQATWRLRDLAQNILRFSRQRHTSAAPVDLNHLIREVLDFFKPLTKAVEVKTRLDRELPPVTADPSQLEQVLVNFLVNALDAVGQKDDAHFAICTGKGELSELKAREEAAGWQTCLAIAPEGDSRRDTWVYAEVRDNGPGIPTQILGEIFEAFFTTKGEEKGTGLGLAISRNIAADHQGNILVASQVGAGASFRLLLPAEESR